MAKTLQQKICKKILKPRIFWQKVQKKNQTKTYIKKISAKNVHNKEEYCQIIAKNFSVANVYGKKLCQIGNIKLKTITQHLYVKSIAENLHRKKCITKNKRKTILQQKIFTG